MSGLRNLTDTVQFKVFVPDITAEVAQQNVPWLLRLNLPVDSVFRDVVEIDHPFNNLLGMLGPSPKKTVGYLFQVPVMEDSLNETLFITSVFAGTSVPWPAACKSGLGHKEVVGDLVCKYLGATSHTGILLVHLQTRVLGGLEEADRLVEEIKGTYLILEPREYDLDKKLMMLAQAQAKPTEVEKTDVG